jgi:hypothetical protein
LYPGCNPRHLYSKYIFAKYANNKVNVGDVTAY